MARRRTKRRANSSLGLGLPRNKWVNARIRVTSGGKIQAAVSEDILGGVGRLFGGGKRKRRRNPEDRRWTISAIRSANREAGYHFFDRDTLKFFSSKVFPTVYQGPGGVYFVTSETMQKDIPSLKRYTVRKSLPESANIQSVEQYRDSVTAKVAARMKARG